MYIKYKSLAVAALLTIFLSTIFAIGFNYGQKIRHWGLSQQIDYPEQADETEDCFMGCFEDTKPMGQHTKDPKECKKYCAPEGWEGDVPKEFPEGIPAHVCPSTYCAKTDGTDPDADCSKSYGCTVFCSEVCCVCLRECI